MSTTLGPPSDAPPGNRIAPQYDRIAVKEIIWRFLRRDLALAYRGTFLGFLWSMVTPAITVGSYYFLFAIVLRSSSAPDAVRPDGTSVPLALYMFVGLSVWNLFASQVIAASSSVTGAAPLLTRVWFPRAILPLASVLSGVVFFAVEFIVVTALVVLTVGWPAPQILWVPLIVAVTVVLTYGLALLMSAAAVFMRDLPHILGLVMRFWMLATPIFYSLELLDSRPGIQMALNLNPLTGIVIGFRNVVLLNRSPDIALLAYSLGVALALLVAGTLVFRRLQWSFPEHL